MKRPTGIIQKGFCIFIFMAVMSFFNSGFAQDPPIVTKWTHPDNLPKPLHEPLHIKENLNLNPIHMENVLLKGFTPPDMNTGRICLIISTSIFSQISSSLDQYTLDLDDAGYSLLTYEYTGGSAEDLRSFLADLYNEPESLVGAVLIGNIPYIIYELMQDFELDGTGIEYEDFPCDIFFMDLDGIWSDTLEDQYVHANNGKYDTRSGNLDLEIWVSRIKTDNLFFPGYTETDMLNVYFDKNHRYRVGDLMPVMKGLAYVDDDWHNTMGLLDGGHLEKIYGKGEVTSVLNTEITTADDYINSRMTDVFEMVTTRSHGYPGGHCYYHDETQKEWVHPSDYLSQDPQALFYSLFVCSGCDFTAMNNLGGTVAFNPDDSGLLVWGSTKTGGMWLDDRFYEILGSRGSFGDAFVNWFNLVQSQPLTGFLAPPWWYGMVILGDGTLRPRITAPVADAGEDKRIISGSGTLDGSHSYDSNGSIVSHEWQIADKFFPLKKTTVTGETPAITDLDKGIYNVTLTVTDNDGLTDTDAMSLTSCFITAAGI